MTFERGNNFQFGFEQLFPPGRGIGSGISIRVEITNDERILAALKNAELFLNNIGIDGSRKLISFAQYAIPAILEAAATKAGNAAFPFPYKIQMINRASNLNYITNASAGPVLNVEMDLNELGTREHLTTAYHRGAVYRSTYSEPEAEYTRGPKGRFVKSQGGHQVQLPWTGGDDDSSLASSVDKRYQYWRAMFQELPYKNIDTSGQYAETIIDRVRTWENLDKAPQWLLLQYGQTEWFPTIDPFPIIEYCNYVMEFAAYTIAQYELTKTIEEAFGKGTHTTTSAGVDYQTAGDVSGKLGKVEQTASSFLQNLQFESAANISKIEYGLLDRLIHDGLGRIIGGG
jgi:hypothetical protein